MSTDQNLEVLINANAAGVKAGMAEAQQSVQQAGQHMAESLKKVEDETKNTVQGMMDLFKRLVTGTAEAHGAAAASAQAATGAMEAGIKSSVTGAQAALSSLGGAFSFVGANLGLLAGVAAGGMAFKEAINATNDWNSSALKLAKQLGITTEEASVQLVALHKLGIEGDVLGGAVQKVSMQLMKGGEAFETMGIKTKDATGQFRPAMEIISETNEKIKEIQNPILQTQAGLAAYGRAWADIRPLMKLTAEGMDEARIKADQLGLVVNSEQAAKTREYKEAMREFGLATEALGINVGRAVLPFFTDLVSVLARVATTVVTAMRPAFDLLSFGFKQVNELVHGAIDVLVEAGHVIADVFGEVAHEVFGESVPRDLEIMVSIFNVVKTLFVGFKVAVQEAFEVLKLGLVVTGIRLVEWATIANRALHLDFAGAADAVREGNQRVEDQLKASAQRMLDIAAAGQKALVDVWSGKKEAPASKKEKQEFNDPNYDFSKKGSGSGKDDSVMRGLEAELAQRKVTYQEAQRLEGSFREFSKQQELEYWQSKLTTVAAGSKDEVAIKMKIAPDSIKFYSFEQGEPAM